MQNNDEKIKMETAGFMVRLTAFCIDNLIVGTVLLFVRLLMSVVMDSLAGTILGGNLIFHYTLKDIVVYILYVSYFIIYTYYSGATLGKRAMNLRVVDLEDGTELTLLNVIYRETVGRFLCKMTVGIGYMTVGVDRENRGLHDFLCDTRVIYAKTVKVYEKKVTVPNYTEMQTSEGYHLTDDEKIDIVDEVNIEENDLQ